MRMSMIITCYITDLVERAFFSTHLRTGQVQTSEGFGNLIGLKFERSILIGLDINLTPQVVFLGRL